MSGDPLRQPVRRSRGDRVEVQIAELAPVVHAAAAPTALCRPDGTFVAVNGAFAELVGVGEAELLDQPFAALIYPDDGRDDLALLHELMSGDRSLGQRTKRFISEEARLTRRSMLRGQKGTIRLDTNLVQADGSAIPCDLTATLIRDGSGEPVHFILHVLERRDSQSGSTPVPDQPRLRELAAASSDLLFFRLRLRPELRFEHISQSVETLCGFTPEDVYADPTIMFEVVHPESAAELAAVLNGSDDGDSQLLLRWRHRNGREVTTKSHHASWYENGELVGVEGVLVDITAQRTAEAAHVHSESRFRALVQHSSDAIIVVDRDARVTYANPTAERILGRDADDGSGTSLWELVHPSDSPMLRRKLEGTATPIAMRLRNVQEEWHWTEAVVTNMLDDDAVAGIVINARDVHDQRAAEAALRDTTVTDALTRLPNRILIEDRIERAVIHCRRSSTVAAVLAVDVDGFATVNRAVGYEGGDQLLVALAERLVSAVPSQDTVGRFAADEFIICAESLTDVDAARSYAQDVQAAISGPLTIGDTSVDVTVSIGIAVADHADVTPKDLLASASSALGQAKSAGGAVSAVYDPAASSQARLRHRRAHDLRHAIERGQISTHFQPIVELDTGTIVAAEALMRWHHPDDGSIAPDEFIPIAEDRGLIGDLSAWVLDEACRQLASWRTDHDHPDLTVSVNLSAVQLANRQIVETLESTLRRHRLPFEALTVEVTESAALGYGHLEVLHEIDSLGVAVALDDFGTHYSSLSYLQRLPLKQLKIDRSFVTGIAEDRSRRAIVMATAQLARGLRLVTVAEGIEDAREMSELQLFGIDRGQGYHFGHPMSAEDFIDHLGSARR